MEVRFWAQTDVGRQRDHNEDNFLIDKQLKLFIVADGMGGHAAGEVASAATVHEIRKYVNERQGVLKAYAAAPDTEDPSRINTLLEGAVRHACAKIHRLAQADESRRGMGSTVDVLLVVGERGFVAHVGDSRVYMLRQGKLHQMTQDHSLINELIRRGRLKPGQSLESPLKNAVTRAVGVYPSVDVDTLDFDILAGDRFLLCTDGLSGYLDESPGTLDERLGTGDPTEITVWLVDYANQSGGKDNITAVVVEAFPRSEELAELMASELRTKIEALRGIPLIRYLNYMELVKLLNVTETSHHEPGAVILKERDPGDSFFVLLEGTVRVVKGDTPIADLEAGAHFGEMALVDDSPRSATIKALERCKTLAIPRERFYELLRQDAQLAVKLLWAFVQVLTVRLRLSSSELAERMTEQELVERMGPLFEEVTAPAVAGLDRLPEPGEAPAGELAMREQDVRAAKLNEDLVAPRGTFDMLEEAVRQSGEMPVVGAGPTKAAPTQLNPAFGTLRTTEASGDLPAAEADRTLSDEELDVLTTVQGLPALSPLQVARARAETGAHATAGDEEDRIDTSPGLQAIPDPQGPED